MYYDFFDYDNNSSSEFESSFHISTFASKLEKKKNRDYRYKPEYTFWSDFPAHITISLNFNTSHELHQE